MSLSSVSVPVKELKEITETRLRSFVYLPKEGLQGEDIPSHILWENAAADYVQVSFHAPLKLKEIFNVEEYDVHDNEIIAKRMETEGYIGLSFETSKVPNLEVVIPVKYLIHLSNGKVIEEVKEIKLFRPELEIKLTEKEEIQIDSRTQFVKGRIKIKNIGRGTLLVGIAATDDSPVEIVTPPEHREFAEKFVSDLIDEMTELAKRFPQFQSVLDETLEWEEKDIKEITEEDRDRLAKYIKKTSTVLASDKNLLQGFADTYAKALAKNSELIEAIGKFIRIYESMVSKDILLVNPLDDVVLHEEKGEITLEISQTDKVFDAYEDITLPRIRLASSKPVKIPVYRLFDWG